MRGVDRADPAAVFSAAVDALNREDFLGAAALCDPASLASFRRDAVQQLAPGTSYAMTADDLLRHEPDMPREVAEYQAARSAWHGDPTHRLRADFPDVASVEALQALSPAELFARWLQGRSWRGQLTRQLAEHPQARAAVERALAQEAPTFPYRVIGALPDGERVAHVLFAMGTLASDADMAPWLAALPDDDARSFMRDLNGRQHPQTALCRRQPDGTWALVADHGFIGMGMMAVAVDVAEEETTRPDESTP